MRVMLADDATLLREGMIRLLEEEGHHVAAAVGDAESLLNALEAAGSARKGADAEAADGAPEPADCALETDGALDSVDGTLDSVDSALDSVDSALEAAGGGGLPDVVVVDVRMPPTQTDEGLRAALEIRERWPGVGVLVLSQYVEKPYARKLITSGQEGVGYLLKDRVMRVEEFLDALERVGTGGVAFDPEMVRQILAEPSHPLDVLTRRERDVLAILAEGRTNAVIADLLHISVSAVEKHVNSIFDKFDLNHVTGYSRRVLATVHYLNSD